MRPLELFQFACAKNVTLREAADIHATDVAKAAHADRMARLYAKGWRP